MFRKIIAIIILLSISIRANSYVVSNGLGDNSIFTSIYSAGSGNAGIASLNFYNVTPLNYSQAAIIDKTQIYASFFGDYLYVKDNTDKGLHINYSFPLFRFLIPVKKNINFGIEYNTKYLSKLDFTNKNIETDYILYDLSYSRINSLNCGTIFSSINLKNRFFLGIAYLYYFGVDNKKKTLDFQDNNYSSFYIREDYKYSGFNLNFSMTFRVMKDLSFALSFLPSKKLDIDKSLEAGNISSSFEQKLYDDFVFPENFIKFGTEINSGISFTGVKRFNIMADFHYRGKDKGLYEKYSTDEIAIGIGLERMSTGDIFDTFWKRCDIRTGLFYKKNGYLDYDKNEIRELFLTFGITLPMKNNRSAIVLSLQIGKRGNLSDNKAEETLVRFGFAISGLETWGIRRGYYK